MEDSNRAVQISPRRPEVGRIGVMHLHPNDGLNFFSPDPWWCISSIRSVLEVTFPYISHLTPRSKTLVFLETSSGCTYPRELRSKSAAGEGINNPAISSTTETTNQSRGNRSYCKTPGLFCQVRDLLTVSSSLPSLPSFVEQQSLYLLPPKPLQAAGSEHHHGKPLTTGFFFLPTSLLLHLSQYDNYGSRSTHLGNEPAVQARDAQSARRPDDASKQED
jgi:hypothetical protein